MHARLGAFLSSFHRLLVLGLVLFSVHHSLTAYLLIYMFDSALNFFLLAKHKTCDFWDSWWERKNHSIYGLLIIYFINFLLL
jgi:hypothetical protein